MNEITIQGTAHFATANTLTLAFYPLRPHTGTLSPRTYTGKLHTASEGGALFVAEENTSHRSQATTLLKLPYGRLSITKRHAVRLTIEIPLDDATLDPVDILVNHADEAALTLDEILPSIKRKTRQ